MKPCKVCGNHSCGFGPAPPTPTPVTPPSPQLPVSSLQAAVPLTTGNLCESPEAPGTEAKRDPLRQT